MIKCNYNINKIKSKLKNYKIKKHYKILFFFLIIFYESIILISRNKIDLKQNFELNKKYLNIQRHINLNFPKILKNKIRIGIYIFSLKGGGAERVTSLFLNYFYKIEIFDLFLFTLNIHEIDEFKIPNNIKRFF